MINLSPREIDVLHASACGERGPAMAIRLGISSHTVNQYLKSARRKLNANNTTSAVAIAMRRNLLHYPPTTRESLAKHL